MKKLKVYGSSRNSNKTTLLVAFNRGVTDEEMRRIHNGLRDWINHGKTVGGEISPQDQVHPVEKVRR